MSQIKKKGKIPQKKGKKGKWIKIACFLLGVAVTLFLIGISNLITGNQEEKLEVKNPNTSQEPCKESKARKNFTKAITPTPRATRNINTGNPNYEVNEEI